MILIGFAIGDYAFLAIEYIYDQIKAKYSNQVIEIKIKLLVQDLGKYIKVAFIVQMRISTEPVFQVWQNKDSFLFYRSRYPTAEQDSQIFLSFPVYSAQLPCF
jgi:hypothetical protein